MKIYNFLFHRVNPKRDQLWDPMDVKLFEKTIKYLSKNFSIVLFEDIVENRISVNSTNKKIATIMFDDGYKDNVEFALPILEKYKLKASFYVVTDCIDLNILTWTHKLEFSFQNTSKSKINLDYEVLPVDLRKMEFNSENDKNLYASKLKPFLKKIDHNNREEILNSIYNQFSDVIFPNLMMNWDDLRALHQKGHYIGSHSKSHFMLGSVDDLNLIEYELSYSGDRIKNELGYFPITISYPIGSYSNNVIDLSKKCGYKCGLAVKQDVYEYSTDNLYEVERIELYNESWIKTWLRITHLLEKFKKNIKYRS